MVVGTVNCGYLAGLKTAYTVYAPSFLAVTLLCSLVSIMENTLIFNNELIHMNFTLKNMYSFVWFQTYSGKYLDPVVG